MDRLEDNFGLVCSMIGNDTNANIFLLATCVSHVVEVRNIFSKHLKWARHLKLHAIEDGNGDILAKVDHINPASWKGDVQLSNFTPITA